jgi:hypothetical protein
MSIVGPIAASIAPILQEQGFSLQTEDILQIAVSTICGEAVRNYEEARQLNMPFVIDKPSERFRLTEPFVDLTAAIARTEEILLKKEKRGKRAATDGTSRYFDALKVATTVTAEVKASGLCVDLQKLMFCTDYPLEKSHELLAKMKHKEIRPTSASISIAAGLVAPLPTRRLKKHLAWLAPQLMRYSHFKTTLAQWVATSHPFVVEFPMPDIEAGQYARSDRIFRSGLHDKAELGLGFMFVVAEPEPWGYTVVTPMMFNRQLAVGKGTGAWRVEFKSEGFRYKKRGLEQLRALLRHRKLHGIAQLNACPHCAQIYASGDEGRLRPDLAGQCICEQGT